MRRALRIPEAADESPHRSRGRLRLVLTVALGLAFIPPEAGAWELTIGGDALVLGDSTRVDHRVEPIFRAGLSAAF